MTLNVGLDGVALSATGVAIDVTKRAEAELGLKEQDARFRATMDAAQVGIFVLQNAIFQFANKFLLTTFGYEAEELIGRLGPLDLVVPEQHAMLAEQMSTGGGRTWQAIRSQRRCVKTVRFFRCKSAVRRQQSMVCLLPSVR